MKTMIALLALVLGACTSTAPIASAAEPCASTDMVVEAADLGRALDFAPTPTPADFAAVDFTVAADLGALPPQPDLTPPPDLKPAIDLAAPPDLTPPPPPADLKPAPRRQLYLGDSITDGAQFPGGARVHLATWYALAGELVDFVGSQVNTNAPDTLTDREHEGHSGWRIDQLEAIAVNLIKTYRPDDVFLLAGANDVYQRATWDLKTSPSHYAALLDNILNADPNVVIYAGTIFDTADGAFVPFVAPFNAELRKVIAARAPRVVLVETHDAMIYKPNEYLYADLYHPNAEGQRRVAWAWWTAKHGAR